MKRTLIAWLILAGPLFAGPDENDVYILRGPEHTMEEVEKAYAEMLPVAYHPPADRWGTCRSRPPCWARAMGRCGS